VQKNAFSPIFSFLFLPARSIMSSEGWWSLLGVEDLVALAESGKLEPIAVDDVLRDKTFVGLYFSAHWYDPPCIGIWVKHARSDSCFLGALRAEDLHHFWWIPTTICTQQKKDFRSYS
jgi:hypothetical protein